MFRNRDRGLSNTFTGSSRSGIRPIMGNYRIVLKVNLKICKHFEQRFSLHRNGEQTCLPELLLVSYFHYVFDYFSKNRYGSAVFIFFKRQMQD